MDFITLTRRYYAEWLDVQPDLFDQKGVFSILSPKRDVCQVGYSRKFDLYALLINHTRIISYGNSLKAMIGPIEQAFAFSDVEEIKAGLRSLTGLTPYHGIKFWFHSLPDQLDTSSATQLALPAYPDFLQFHKSLYPDSHSENWLEEYYQSIAGRGYAFGIYTDGKLTCATDTPDMPYMGEFIVEIGVNTLPEYRQRGQARAAAGGLIKYILKMEKVPLWSTGYSNTASQKLATSLGFIKLADVLALTCEP